MIIIPSVIHSPSASLTLTIKRGLQLVHGALLAGPLGELVLGADRGECRAGLAELTPALNERSVFGTVEEEGIEGEELPSSEM